MAKIIVVFFIAFLVGMLIWANYPIEQLHDSTKIDRIVVEKKDRKMTLYHNGRILKSYDISLGRSPIGAKEKEGDKKTPEGIYNIIEHFEPSAFHRSLRISYPSKIDIQRAEKEGVSAGADIMIHGMRNGLGIVGKMHLWFDWTAGCIAVTNQEIEELWRVVPDGIEIEIKP